MDSMKKLSGYLKPLYDRGMYMFKGSTKKCLKRLSNDSFQNWRKRSGREKKSWIKHRKRFRMREKKKCRTLGDYEILRSGFVCKPLDCTYFECQPFFLYCFKVHVVLLLYFIRFPFCICDSWKGKEKQLFSLACQLQIQMNQKLDAIEILQHFSCQIYRLKNIQNEYHSGIYLWLRRLIEVLGVILKLLRTTPFTLESQKKTAEGLDHIYGSLNEKKKRFVLQFE